MIRIEKVDGNNGWKSLPFIVGAVAFTASSGRITTALTTLTTLDSFSSIVTLTVELAMASAVRFAKARSSPETVVSNRSSGCSKSLSKRGSRQWLEEWEIGHSGTNEMVPDLR